MRSRREALMIFGSARSCRRHAADDAPAAGPVACRRRRPARPSSGRRRAACPAGCRSDPSCGWPASARGSPPASARRSRSWRRPPRPSARRRPARPARSGVSTSPMPRMRLAIRSGWKTSKSSSFSPVDANRIGTPVTSRTDSAAPPRASPSSLVSTTPVKPTPAPNASAVVTASWPIMASRTNSVSSGVHGVADGGGLRHQLLVDAQAAGGVDDHDVEVLGPGLGKARGGDRDRVARAGAPRVLRVGGGTRMRREHLTRRPARRRSAAG